MKFKVVSFYTIGTQYEQEIKALKISLIDLGIPHDIRGVSSLGSWDLNTKIKPAFIKEMLQVHPEDSIVWLDADAVVMKYPHIFGQIDTDIGVYYKTTGPTADRFKGQELISASMYFANNRRTRELLDMWIQEQNRIDQPETQLIEQRALHRSIPIWRREHKGTITILPQSYCRIFDAEEDHRVIEQRQASRRFGRE
jgi:hypothetical protein